jgi:hypothetical protein
MNTINGGSAIGYGFNALGTYDPSSLMSQVFTQTFNLKKTYTSSSNITYAVPDNVNVIDYTPKSGGTRVFTTQYDLQTYLSVSADLKASYGAFSGQVSASYSSAVQEWGSCFYALTDGWDGEWTLVIQAVDQSQITPEFAAALNQLPTAFDPSAPDAFFEFFYEYGSHYVHSVGVGGYYSYYEGVANNGSYSQQQVQANVALEYKAVFVDASAQSSADWQQLGQSWSTNRQVTIEAQGGDASVLTDLSPVFDTSAASSFKNWLGSVGKNPAPIQYFLHEWTELLPANSPRQIAVQQATKAYLNYNIYVNATMRTDGSGSAAINVLGHNLQLNVWPPNPTYSVSGIAIALVNQHTLQATLRSVYYFSDAAGSNATALYNQLLSDIGAANIDNSWLALAAFNYPWGIAPDSRLSNWLQNFGINDKVWIDNYYNCGMGGAGYNFVAVGDFTADYSDQSFSIGYSTAIQINEVNVNPFLARIGARKALRDIKRA